MRFPCDRNEMAKGAPDLVRCALLALQVLMLGITSLACLTGQASLASSWQTTEGLFAASLNQVKATDIDTEAWNAELDLRLERELGNRHHVVVDADWDYGEVRDAVARTRSFSPDLIDLDVKLLRESRPPFAAFLSVNYLSEHDLKPGVLGAGLGYRARLLSGLIAELSLQGTKDTTSGLGPQAGYRFALSYKQPLIRGLELWVDGRSQGGFQTGATRQDFVEIRGLYALASRLKLTYIQRLENPLQFDTFRKTTSLLLGYDLH